MFIDLRNLDDNSVLEADICIVGAGPAGISMARRLIGTSIDVLMIESGDLEFDDATQALYQGDSVGMPYFGLDEARLRFFGGSSNHWDNWCGEFQPIDFAGAVVGPVQRLAVRTFGAGTLVRSGPPDLFAGTQAEERGYLEEAER